MVYGQMSTPKGTTIDAAVYAIRELHRDCIASALAASDIIFLAFDKFSDTPRSFIVLQARFRGRPSDDGSSVWHSELLDLGLAPGAGGIAPYIIAVLEAYNARQRRLGLRVTTLLCISGTLTDNANDVKGKISGEEARGAARQLEHQRFLMYRDECSRVAVALPPLRAFVIIGCGDHIANIMGTSAASSFVRWVLCVLLLLSMALFFACMVREGNPTLCTKRVLRFHEHI
jgi:hypothetical protein